jgi:hypothetical protein
MIDASLSIREDYWETFQFEAEDMELIYNHLIEIETPLTSQELTLVLINGRIQQEKQRIKEERTAGSDIYKPNGKYKLDQMLVFPALGWQRGKVVDTRVGKNPDFGSFQIINVDFDGGNRKEFAAELENHILNEPVKITESTEDLNPDFVLANFESTIEQAIEKNLEGSTDFVRIAGRWFPRELLVEINEGHLNLAEAALDIVEGGPLPISALLEQIELDSKVNPKLVEFSLDLALQEDKRFDEVGPAGDVLWFLKRLEPESVQETPMYLKYKPIEYDRSALDSEMIALERLLDDELSPIDNNYTFMDEAEIRLILPHWITGTLPLSARIRHLFPTAYEAPRIRFILIDGESGDNFPGWVVLNEKYVYGFKEWYEEKNLIPGSIIQIKKGKKTGEVIVYSESGRSNREWIRTLLIGTDGGIVLAMLKQIISTKIDDRMAIAIPDEDAIPLAWEKRIQEKPNFENLVVKIVHELAKLNPQNHAHATEIYAALNTTLRCPPGPILALLATSQRFTHVGDLYFRLQDLDEIDKD